MNKRYSVVGLWSCTALMGLMSCSGQAPRNPEGSAGASTGGAVAAAGAQNTGGTQNMDSARNAGGLSSVGGKGGNFGGTHAATVRGTTSSTTAACTNPAHVFPLNPSDPQDGVSIGSYYVATDTWNAEGYDVSQTLYVCDYNNWYVIANMNNETGDGAVKTYPNVHRDFNDAPRINSFGTITSTFAHTVPRVGIYNVAYDIWVNGVASNGSTEIMIWTDNYNQVPSGSVVETTTVDERTYRVHKVGSYIAFVDSTNVSSGTIDILAILNHVITKGWIPATSTLGQIDYGIEFVSTDGTDATFQLQDFSIVAR